MLRSQDLISSVDLRRVRVLDVAKESFAHWDSLVVEHHYLASRGMIGRSLRQVAVDGDGQWLALLGWASGAFRCGARDQWIGWLPSQQLRRLPLVVNNVRFLVLPWVQVPHLASRVLGLSLRGLPAAWRARHGATPLIAETFVDGARFRGTCYVAAGWQRLGETRGFGRSNGRYVAHGRVKQVLVKRLHPQACELLSSAVAPTRFLPQETAMEPLALRLTGTGSLKEALSAVMDPRGASGKEHKDFAGMMTMIVMAMLAGMTSLRGMAEYISRIPQPILRACGSPMSMVDGSVRPPSEPTIRRTVQKVSGEHLDEVIANWLRSQGYGSVDGAIALDGKTLRGSHRGGHARVELVAAYDHSTGAILAQAETTSISGELQTTSELIDRLGEEQLCGRVVTCDALHTQHDRCRQIVKKKPTFC
jgi:hypothetical protein